MPPVTNTEIEANLHILSEPETVVPPGFFEKISRPADIKLIYSDLDGVQKEIKPEGLLTKVIHHEMDHLNGKLFVDHISELKRRRIRNKIVKQK